MRLNKVNVARLALPEGKNEVLVFDETLLGFVLQRNIFCAQQTSLLRELSQRLNVIFESIGRLYPNCLSSACAVRDVSARLAEIAGSNGSFAANRARASLSAYFPGRSAKGCSTQTRSLARTKQ